MNKKKLPKSTKEMSKEKLLEILKKKKICNTRAVQIVDILSERVVDKNWMLANLFHINQSHYDDIVAERAICKYCGYPLCTSDLGEIPKQQYRISLTNTTVYDLTDRKKFCTNSCFKASEYLKAQILTSPLWFRENEPVPNFKIYEKNTQHNKHVEEIIETDKNDIKVVERKSVRQDCTEDQLSNRQEKPDSANDVSNSKKEADLEVRVVKQEPIPNKTKIQLVILDPVSRVEKVVSEWFTFNSYIHLFGEEKLKQELQDQTNLIKDLGNRETGLATRDERFEEISKLFSILKLDGDTTDEAKELKPLPDYSILKHEAKNLNIKVRAFYTGQLETTTSTSSDPTQKNDEGMPGVMPYVDRTAQVALRRRVVLDRLNRSVKELFVNLDFTDSIDLSDIRTLVRTFALSADNVTFKPRELPLLSALIIKMLSYKSEKLAQHLSSNSSLQRMGYLLDGYKLPSDYLQSYMEYLLNVKRLTQTLTR